MSYYSPPKAWSTCSNEDFANWYREEGHLCMWKQQRQPEEFFPGKNTNFILEPLIHCTLYFIFSFISSIKQKSGRSILAFLFYPKLNVEFCGFLLNDQHWLAWVDVREWWSSIRKSDQCLSVWTIAALGTHPDPVSIPLVNHSVEKVKVRKN